MASSTKMTVFVSFLRGVNVGGHKRVRMVDLAKVYDSLGFDKVQTYIQSGNVVFSCTKEDMATLASRIARKMENQLGLTADVFIRTLDEIEELRARSPFKKDQIRVHVTFLKDKLLQVATDKLDAVRGEDEEYLVSGKEVFLYLPSGYGRSKLSNALLERVLKTRATTRNWNTVQALLQMAKDIIKK